MTDIDAQNRNAQRNSRIVWFEIPATDLDRAVKFYQAILQIEVKHEQMGGEQLAVFAYQPPAISGCIIAGKDYTPGKGPLVYLNADPDLQAALDRVEAAGGKILIPRTALPPGMGFFARILDTEGNQVGLHAVI